MDHYIGISEWLDVDDDSVAIGLTNCPDPMVEIPLEVLLDAHVTLGDIGGELTMVFAGSDLPAGALDKAQIITVKFSKAEASSFTSLAYRLLQGPQDSQQQADVKP